MEKKTSFFREKIFENAHSREVVYRERFPRKNSFLNTFSLLSCGERWRKRGNEGVPLPESLPRKKDPCWLLEKILSGTAVLESEGSRHILKAGDLFLLPPFTQGDLFAEGEMPLVSRFLRIRDNAVMAGMGEPLAVKNAGLFHFPEQDFAGDLVEKILEIASSGEPETFSSPEETLSLLCYKLFYLLSRRKKTDAGESRFELFLRHLAATPGRPHTLASMAEWCGVTPRTLTRLFRKKLSTSPVQYLAGIRLEYAAMLFRKETPPPAVKDVAERCGYGNVPFFTRDFRKRYLLSPREYRKRGKT